MKHSLKLLREAKKVRPENFKSGTRAEHIQAAGAKLPFPIPPAWQEVLRISNGLSLGSDGYDFRAAEELPDFHQQEQGAVVSGTSLPQSLLHIGSVPNGDFISLDVSTLDLTGDCNILLISHETLTPEREWGSVADFLEEMLTMETENSALV